MFSDEHYNEIPVSIEEFIISEEYLGRSTSNGRSIYPYWHSLLNNFFNENKHELLLTGALGTGKTKITAICACYALYKLMCLKNPCEEFRFVEDSDISLFFLNTSSTNANVGLFTTVHSMLLTSPWFMKHGKVVGRTQHRYKPDGNINLMYGSTKNNILGVNLYAVFVDEPVVRDNTAEKQCVNLIDVYIAAQARIKSRFTKDGNLYGYSALVSTKLPTHDYINKYIDTRKSFDDVLVSDEPQWNIKPREMFSDKEFIVAVGGNLINPFIISNSDYIDVFKSMGCTILDIPENFYDCYKLDAKGTLRMVGGITC